MENKTKNLYFDCETTGLDHIRNDIIQIGAILEVDGEEKNSFMGTCRPFNILSVSPQALAVNQTTIEQLKEYQDPKKLFKDFLTFLAPYFGKEDKSKFTLVGQNIKFDYEFLRSFFYKNGYNSVAFNKIFDYHTVDLLSLTYLLRQRGIIPKNSKLKLEVMQKYFGVKVAKLHDALEDIRCTYEIMKTIDKHLLKDASEINWELIDQETPLYKHHHQALSTNS